MNNKTVPKKAVSVASAVIKMLNEADKATKEKKGGKLEGKN